MFHLAESLATHAPQAGGGREKEASSEMHGLCGALETCVGQIF